MSTENLLAFHHWLLADAGRTGAYQRAISQIVRKNDVVLDIGAGTGILSFFACLAGARKVYAVETSDALVLARELSAHNGFDGKIEFLHELSQNIQLPESMDVIVSDTGASFGLQGRMLGTLLDARQRFLKPGGRLIPYALRLFVAPVELSDGRSLEIWNEDGYGLDLSAVRRFAANTNYLWNLKAEDLLASPALLVALHFEAGEQPICGRGDLYHRSARRSDTRTGRMDGGRVSPRQFHSPIHPLEPTGELESQFLPHRETGGIAERRSRPG